MVLNDGGTGETLWNLEQVTDFKAKLDKVHEGGSN